jgi:transposase
MKKHIVSLTAKERLFLRRFVTSGSHKAREITRARILLLSALGKIDTVIVVALGCSLSMVRSVRRRFDERRDIQAVITDAPRPGQPAKLKPHHEAFIVATACTPAPSAHAHWTAAALRQTLLATYQDIQDISAEPIRKLLVRHRLKPWREKNVVRPQADRAVQGADGRHPVPVH